MSNSIGLIDAGYRGEIMASCDNIKDFEIEAISIGDSLLTYYKEDEINKNYYPESNKFYYSWFAIDDSKKYSEIQVIMKDNDKKFIVHGLRAGKMYPDKIDECLKKKKEIINELIELVNKKKIDSYMHYYDNSRLNIGLDVEFKSESKSHISDINFDSGDKMRIWCDDWSDEVSKKRNWPDALNVNLTSKSFDDWLINESEGQ